MYLKFIYPHKIISLLNMIICVLNLGFLYYFVKYFLLNKLQIIQGEVREKELEIDALTDRIQQLHKGPSKRRVSQLSEVGIRYQLLVSKVRVRRKYFYYLQIESILFSFYN